MTTSSPAITTSDIVTPLVSACLGVAIAAVAPFLGLEDELTKQILTLVAALVTAVPPLVAILRRRRRRDRVADLGDLEAHRLRRSIPIAMTLVVALLLIIDSLSGLAIAAFAGLPWEAVALTQYVPLAAFLAATFFIAALAAPYLGGHPYLLALVALVLMIVLRLVIIALIFTDDALAAAGLTVLQVQMATVGSHVLTTTVVLLGDWAGVGRRDLTIAKKAARLAAALEAEGILPDDLRSALSAEDASRAVPPADVGGRS